METEVSGLGLRVSYPENIPLWLACITLAVCTLALCRGYSNYRSAPNTWVNTPSNSAPGEKDIKTPEVDSQKDGYPSIEPLAGFDWASTEPLSFRPFKSKYHLTMALSSLDVSDLIPMDKTYKERIALRTSLLQEHPDVVVRVNPAADERVYTAIRELYAFIVGTYLPTRYPTMFRLTHDINGVEVLENQALPGQMVPLHPSGPDTPAGRAELELLATLVDEEFLILLPDKESLDGDPKYILEAYTTCFPSGFDTRKKLGLRLADIHEPVPGYETKLERSMDRFFARIEVGKFVQRVNWSITTQTELFAAFGGVHGAEGEQPISQGELDVNSTVVRCERQTLHRLPRSKALVFAFHTYTYPIRTIKEEGLGEDLAAAIDGLKEGNVPQMHWYKRGPIWGDAVKHFLRS
ncbi:hypothetical protein FE257_008034 [Aspergillus nanangensis]|uniref:Uncharacterized protein n=1 Tax=Aspergillus nanangensis TaxID=2582783 RepID=A0AAD4CMG7_ASPNN|nr:hypothetical protein FE257_008034 [Aspergillus nanangensis]